MKSDLAMASGAFVIACACLVLAGWAHGLDDLKGLLMPGIPPVPPISALSVGILGCSLVLYGSGARPRFAWPWAAVAAAVGLFSLTAHVFGFGSPLFQILFRDQLTASGGNLSGRPAPTTALCLLLIGLALVVIRAPHAWLQLGGQGALLVSFAASWTTLFSFSVNASAIYKVPWHPASGMNVFTAFGVLIVSVGALALRTDKGIGQVLVSKTLGGRFSRLLLLVILLVPIVLGAFVLRWSDTGGALPTEHATWVVSLYCLMIAGVAIRMSWRAATYESRLLASQAEHEKLISDLKRTLAEVSVLEHDMIRICAWTKMIEDEGRWIPFEQFLEERLHLHVTQGLSPQAIEMLKRGEAPVQQDT